MLASRLLARARRIRLPGRAPTDADLAGEYRSAFRGAGMEFEDCREYAPGDDTAAIDWKVTARLGRPFVKRFREERERLVLVAVDLSRSMACGEPPLVEGAAEAAVVLAVSCAANRDRVGLVLFSDRVEAFVPPGKGPGQAMTVAAALAGTRPAGTATDPDPAIALLAATARRRSTIFVFSDFLAPGFAPGLGRLAGRHDLIAGLVAAPEADLLPESGLVTVADAETGRRVVLDRGSAKARARYAAARAQTRAATREALRGVGADVLDLPAAGPMAPVLAAFFHRREGRAGGTMRAAPRPSAPTAPLLEQPG